MKQLIIITLLFIHAAVQAQEPREVTEADLQKINASTILAAEKLSNELKNSPSYYFLNRDLEIQFWIDTFKIEEVQRKKLQIDFSTAGMLTSTYSALDAYDILLNKYYQILMEDLSQSDQKVLKKTQRNWLKFRDSEIEMINVMEKEEYSGGGTIQPIITASRVLSLTKERLKEILDHTVLIMEK